LGDEVQRRKKIGPRKKQGAIENGRVLYPTCSVNPALPRKKEKRGEKRSIERHLRCNVLPRGEDSKK